jgi:hypothetical protein
MSLKDKLGQFAESVWTEIRPFVMTIVGDACLFVLLLFVLFIGFAAVHALARIGYPTERIEPTFPF